MKSLDRINYKGFSKEFVKQRLELNLDPRLTHIFAPVMTSDEARNLILKNRKGLISILVKLAFHLKEIIKYTPLKSGCREPREAKRNDLGVCRT